MRNGRGPAGGARTLRASLDDPAHLLFAVAAFLDYWPAESLVVAFVCDRALAGAVRIDLTAFTPELLAEVIKPADVRLGEPRLLACGYGDRAVVDAVLDAAELCLPPERFLDRLGTDGRMAWQGDGPGGLLPAGLGLVAGGGARGPFGVLTSRDALVARVRRPDLATQQDLGQLVEDGLRRLEPLSREERRARVHEVIARAPLDRRDQVELALLVSDMDCRDEAWTLITPEDAGSWLDLWLGVRAASIDLLAPDVLCLAATAAWLDGQWLLMGECLRQASEVDAGHSLTALLEQVWVSGAPPDLWRRFVRGQEST